MTAVLKAERITKRWNGESSRRSGRRLIAANLFTPESAS